MATTPAEAGKRAQSIAELPGVAGTEAVSPDEGLAEFRKLSGIGDALEALPENPLPWLVKVRPAPPRDTAPAVEALAAEIRRMDGVDLVQADTAWVRRLHAIEDTLQQLVLVVAALLAAGVLGVVGNTIRLEIDGRRAEIEVTKLVGGSNAFVRRPFLYSGLWQGLFGGLFAAGLVTAGLVVLGLTSCGSPRLTAPLSSCRASRSATGRSSSRGAPHSGSWAHGWPPRTISGGSSRGPNVLFILKMIEPLAGTFGPLSTLLS